MAQVTLESVWNEVKALSLDEKAILRQRLDEEAHSAAKLAAVMQQMRDKGMITSERQPRNPSDPPVKAWVIDGEPLSETIIRERG